MTKTMEEILAKCKSLKIIEGQGPVLEFLRKREEDRRKAGEPAMVNIKQVPDSDRFYIERNIPTGFRQKKTLITVDKARKFAEASGVVWEDGFEKPDLRALAWRMSDERVDRHGDIVRQNFDWTNFDKNPVFLNCHNWSSEGLIGSVIYRETVRVVEEGYSGPATNGICLFSPFEVDPEADRLYRLARANIARAGSIGFFPMIVIYVQDDQERTDLGLGRWGVIYDKSEMAEFSICPIPANSGALQNGLRKMIQRGLVSIADAPTLKHLFSQPDCEKAIDEIFIVKAPDKPEVKAGEKAGEKPGEKTPPETMEVDVKTIEARTAALETQNASLLKTLEGMNKNLEVLTAVVAGTMSCIRGGMEDLFKNQEQLGGEPVDPATEKEIDDLDPDDKDDTSHAESPLGASGEGEEDDDDMDFDTDDDSDESKSEDEDELGEIDLEDLDGDSDESDSDDGL